MVDGVMQKELPVRKKIRLEGYDYSSNGAYFITICSKNQQNIFTLCRGDPCGRPCSHNQNGFELNELGEICKNIIYEIEKKYNITIQKYIIMPNHIHMIILISPDTSRASPDTSRASPDTSRATARVAPTIGRIIGGYKSIISNAWLKKCKENNVYMGQIWQSRFYDRIIRNETEYKHIWRYIEENPEKWEEVYNEQYK